MLSVLDESRMVINRLFEEKPMAGTSSSCSTTHCAEGFNNNLRLFRFHSNNFFMLHANLSSPNSSRPQFNLPGAPVSMIQTRPALIKM